MSWILTLLVGMAWPVSAQSRKGGGFNANRKRLQEQRMEQEAEAARMRLLQARQEAEAERQRIAEEEAAAEALQEKAEDAAGTTRETVLSEGQKALVENGAAAMASTLSRLSDEGRERMSEAAEVEPTPTARPLGGVQVAQAASPADSAAAAQPNPPSPDAPKPQPLKPASLESDRDELERIVILCDGSAYFDPKNSIGIFTENVRVYHPDFYIEGDELEIHMKKSDAAVEEVESADAEEPELTTPLVTDAAAAAGGTPAGGSPEDEPPVGAVQQTGSIDFVIVRGSMVLIEKNTETGEVQVGKCQKAVYDADTGEVLLSIWPQVQRGPQVQIATDPDTTMTIYPNGSFKSSGTTKTDILRGNDPRLKTKPLRRLPPQ